MQQQVGSSVLMQKGLEVSHGYVKTYEWARRVTDLGMRRTYTREIYCIN